MDTLLKTERLTLRRFTEADVDHLFALDNDAEVMHFINDGEPTPFHLIQDEILPRFMAQNGRFPAFGFWAADEVTTGDFIGWFSFRIADDAPQTVTLGYRLRRVAWGKGYATEGSRALINLGFTELGVQRVKASTYEYNVGSRRVMEKSGMRLVRRFRLTADDLQASDTSHNTSDEVWDGDEVEYAVTRVEWEANQ